MRPDLLILDWKLPLLDTEALIRSIRQQEASGPLVPIVVARYEWDGPSTDTFRDAGATEFLTKPFVQTAIHRLVNQFFEGNSPPATPSIVWTRGTLPVTADLSKSSLD